MPVAVEQADQRDGHVELVGGETHDAVEALLGRGVQHQQFAQGLQAGGEIGQHVNTAITSMQFQDMTSQLLDRTLRRVTRGSDTSTIVNSLFALPAARVAQPTRDWRSDSRSA